MAKCKLHPCRATGAEFLCAPGRVKPISLWTVQPAAELASSQRSREVLSARSSLSYFYLEHPHIGTTTLNDTPTSTRGIHYRFGSCATRRFFGGSFGEDELGIDEIELGIDGDEPGIDKDELSIGEDDLIIGEHELGIGVVDELPSKTRSETSSISTSPSSTVYQPHLFCSAIAISSSLLAVGSDVFQV